MISAQIGCHRATRNCGITPPRLLDSQVDASSATYGTGRTRSLFHDRQPYFSMGTRHSMDRLQQREIPRPMRSKLNTASRKRSPDGAQSGAMGQAVTHAGIHKHLTPHGFRHSFAPHLLARGTETCTVHELQVHKVASTTMIYLCAHAESAGDRRAQFFGGPAQGREEHAPRQRSRDVHPLSAAAFPHLCCVW
jgi:Phage integrase family